MDSLQNSVSRSDAVPTWAGWIMGAPGLVLAFLWGFAEGTLFFILPDVLLSFVAMYRPRRTLSHTVLVVAGAVLAGALMFSWSERSESARRAVSHVPAVTPAMFDRAERDFHDHGLWGTSLGPVRGIPYKVYAVEAPAHSALWPFLLVTMPARLWRLVVVWLGFAAAGVVLRKIRRASLLPAVYALFWIVTYAIYWTTIR